MTALIAIDAGAAATKQLVSGAAGARPLGDRRLAALRTATISADTPARAAACLALARADAPDVRGLAVVAHDDAEARALSEALARTAPDLPTVSLPAAVAVALAHTDDVPPDRALDLVLDLGQSALRLSLVRWHRVGADAFPLLESVADVGPGGARLDARLAEVAHRAGEAPAFHELKELVLATRGPWVRAWGASQARVGCQAGAEAVLAWLGEVERAVPALVARVREATARRVLIVGGLAHVAPLLAAVTRALAPLPVIVARDPLFAAGRGALRALERPASPRAQTSLSLVIRGPRGVVAEQVVAAGARLPGRFGPVRLRSARAGDASLQVLEGDRVLEARVRAPAEAVDAWLAWEFGHGWTLELTSAAGGVVSPPASLASVPPAVAQATRDALLFDWAAHSQPVPLDCVLVFRATTGGADGVSKAVGEAVAHLATAAVTHNPDVRLRAIAVGDHPQGHLRPPFITLAQPAWTERVEDLSRWCTERLAQPIDGIDAAEAYECGLKEAGALDWRADAERLLLLLADAPPHTPDAPPYCPVDWRAEVKRLRDQRVRVVPVHVAVGGTPPTLRRQVLSFLEGVGDVLPLRSGTPSPELISAVTAAAGVRRMDPAAKRVLDGVAFEAS